MKSLVTCFGWLAVALMYCSQARAAAINWPGASLSQYGEVNYTLFSDASSYGRASVDLLILDGGSFSTLSAQGASVGILQIWIATSAGTPIDALSFDSASVFANNSPYMLGSIQMTANEPFYLEFGLGGTPVGQGSLGSQGSAYGWVELVYDGTTLTLLDSAAETTGIGIYAGTYTAIPEPCTAGLALAGLGAIALRRKLRRSKCMSTR